MLRLRYRGTTTIPVEADCVSPNNFTGKTIAEIALLPVQYGNASAPLGEFFTVEGDASDGDILIEGDCGRVKLLGTGMTMGRLTIHGNAGMHLGAEMKGGEIHLHGNADDWVGAEMKGGRIHIHGDAGHLVGAAYRGGRFGMRGGTILIDGKAGNEIGATMRRGLIVIGGISGDFPGVSMIAGSIFLFGAGGVRPGAGMKRGTLAFFAAPPPLLHSFRYCCTYHPIFLDVYLRHLKAWGFPLEERYLAGNWRRWCGDLVSLGRGEILTWQEN